jgi:hypothetical protein
MTDLHKSATKLQIIAEGFGHKFAHMPGICKSDKRLVFYFFEYLVSLKP